MTNEAWRKSPSDATPLLVLLSLATLEVARFGNMYTPQLWSLVSVSAACVAMFCFFLGAYRGGERGVAMAISLVSTLLLAEPLVVELVARQFWEQGRPGEILLLDLIRGFMLTLLVLGQRAERRSLAATLSLFLCVGSIAIVTSLAGLIMVMLYALIGSWWLMGRHWEGLRVKLPVTTQVHMPWATAWGGTSLAVVVLLLATAAVTAGWSTSPLAGWLPTSGGERGKDPFATRGVGDGDATLAAEEYADSFGAVESQVFLSTHHTSLYDMFDESYGEPTRSREQQGRAVSVTLNTQQKNKHDLRSSQQAGQDFSTVRSPPQSRRRTLDNAKSEALFFVAGRVPLHLRLESFDTFNGREWLQTQERPELPLSMAQEEGHPWLQIVAPFAPFWRSARTGSEHHVLKMIQLPSARFPSPPQLTGVHIAQIDKRAFFSWTTDGQLALHNRDRIPAYTVVHISSESVVPHSLAPAAFVRSDHTPEADDPWAKLAHEWTAGASTPAAQLEAIAAQLATHYTVDRNAVVPDESAHDPVAYFLFTSRRGPDYLFATAASRLLAALGYQTRLATGFYARPEDYDATSGGVMVEPDDVHTWLEVALEGERWLTFEPTPGYAVLLPRRTAWEWSRDQVLAAYHAVLRNPLFSLAGVMSSLLLVRYWRPWLDLAAYFLWWCAVRWNPAGALAATWRLLQWRAYMAGRPRPASMPASRWLREYVARRNVAVASDCEQLSRSLALALYGSPEVFAAAAQHHALIQSCLRVARAVSLECLRGGPRVTSFSVSPSAS